MGKFLCIIIAFTGCVTSLKSVADTTGFCLTGHGKDGNLCYSILHRHEIHLYRPGYHTSADAE